MPRLLAHLLLLLYAGLFLHCQPLPARARATATSYNTRPEPARPGFCKKKVPAVQASPPADYAQSVKAKLPPLHLVPGSFAAVFFGLLFPADAAGIAPARGPASGPAQVFANHPNKAPPVRFS